MFTFQIDLLVLNDRSCAFFSSILECQMRLRNLVTILLTLVATPAGAEEPAVKLTTDAEKLSYAIGVDMVEAMDQMPKDLNLNRELVVRGLQDALKGKEVLTSDERKKIKIDFGKKMQEEMEKKIEEKRNENIAKGKEFLEKNKVRPEVKTTASGLQYEILTEGTGEQPQATDTVSVHYKGFLINGEEFDSSYARKQPASFPLNGVIKGWGEGVQLMKVGSKFKFYLPSDLAYGERGAPPKIGPNETLIFEVELLSITPSTK